MSRHDTAFSYQRVRNGCPISYTNFIAIHPAVRRPFQKTSGGASTLPVRARVKAPDVEVVKFAYNTGPGRQSHRTSRAGRLRPLLLPLAFNPAVSPQPITNTPPILSPCQALRVQFVLCISASQLPVPFIPRHRSKAVASSLLFFLTPFHRNKTQIAIITFVQDSGRNTWRNSGRHDTTRPS